MGLDITAYSNLKKLDCVFDDEGEPISAETRQHLEYDLHVYENTDFPGRADGLQDRAVYAADDTIRFRAGSYGGYNAWREELARIAGYPLTDYSKYERISKRHDAGAWAVESGPFWELINFSDCEGVIGPLVSAKLAKDFSDFDAVAKLSEKAYFYEMYSQWREAFEMASNNGAVDFH